MESTPPSHRSETRSRTKSASRLSQIRHYSEETGLTIPQLSLEIVASSPKISTSSPASTLSPRPPYALPLRELLLLSPSPLKRSKTRLAERLEMADEAAIEPNGVRKRCKSRNSAMGYSASPRNTRRSRRRLDQEIREDKEFCVCEEMVKPRKKRHSGRSKKDKLSSVPSTPSPKTIDGDGCNLNKIGQLINDLVMWKDVSKSSLWFGFGSICFLSSCFTKGVNFSIFSLISQLGLLVLGVSFFSNSMRQRWISYFRDANEIKLEFKLTDADILKVGRLILPAANLVISKTRELFSGEPATTLKVVPLFLIGAEYGHIITLWRLCALGFFISFTGPKLYSSYSVQLCRIVERLKLWVSETWGACSHKKIVAASAVTAFWNLTSIRTRIFAAFLCLVIVRYRRQHSEGEEVEEEIIMEEKQEQTLVAIGSHN
ncbi:Hypothetical predicted protein [Olea europaea subsp. europaea]|uniref:Reticulon-like protein n=1 Tax=Olea europaea subsp. europaea TaxID=158383 RepID=A0A8S0V6M2_OLEEU|nr:Hypothetical predicted protein [Olea europaea subsp. europaea]